MAYYFMAEKKRGEYLQLDIRKSKYFPTIPKFNKPFAYTLQEIDTFTMMFNNEQELRNTLIEERILPSELASRALSTRILLKGSYNKVPHDFLYQKDIEYVHNPVKLIELIMKRYHQNDFLFIKKFADYFSNCYECRSTAPEIRQLAEISIRENRRNYHLDEIDQNGDKQVARLVKLLILKHYERPDGIIEYKNDVNYRNLHDVIAFINNYDKKTISPVETPPSIPKQESKIASIVPIKQNNIEVKTKKRTKKNYTLEGQIDFSELI